MHLFWGGAIFLSLFSFQGWHKKIVKVCLTFACSLNLKILGNWITPLEKHNDAVYTPEVWHSPWKKVGKEDDPFHSFPIGALFTSLFRGKLLAVFNFGRVLFSDSPPSIVSRKSSADSCNWPCCQRPVAAVTCVNQGRSTPCIGDGRPPTFNRESL